MTTDTMKKGRPWTYNDIDILRREFPVRTTDEIAVMLRRSERAVQVKASLLGLKRENHGIVWTPQMIRTLTDYFPVMFNKPLAMWLRVSMRSMIRKARELGLEKKAGFLEDRRKDIARLQSEGLKNTDKKGGRIQKGEHRNPAGEFRKGHKESPESKARRIEGMKEYHRRRKAREKFRKDYNINI